METPGSPRPPHSKIWGIATPQTPSIDAYASNIHMRNSQGFISEPRYLKDAHEPDRQFEGAAKKAAALDILEAPSYGICVPTTLRMHIIFMNTSDASNDWRRRRLSISMASYHHYNKVFF